jgi:hypothetical protein
MQKKNREKLERFQTTPPGILSWRGQNEWEQPRHKVRFFHHRPVAGWSGYVKTTDIHGWVNNVRIALFVEKWKRDHKGAAPTNDEILDWMVTDPYGEFELPSLGESIVKNGVRQEIVIKADGTLLDGNRRYFASLYKLRESKKSGDSEVERMVSHLPAFVLSPTCTDVDFDSVLVEENFVDDCRRAWPNFIKAQRVFDAYKELTGGEQSKASVIATLVERFGMKKPHLERWIKMMNYIEEFHLFHVSGDDDEGVLPKDEYEVKWQSQKYFEYFDELTKPDVAKALDNDLELRDKVFERLFDNDFRNFKQIRSLPAISRDLRARDKFMLGDGQEAVDDAIDWVSVVGLTRKALQVNDRVLSFAKFLGSLTASDIDRLDPMALDALHEIAEKVSEMAKAVKPQI